MKVAQIVLTTKQKIPEGHDDHCILKVLVKKLFFFCQIDDFQDERLRKPEMPAQLTKPFINTQLL